MESTAPSLAEELRALQFSGPQAYQHRWRTHQDRLVHQLDHYIVPRLNNLSGPLIVVVGGSTGAGKSTLINSITGQHVVSAGVLRPTTTSPTVLVHPSEETSLHASGMNRLQSFAHSQDPSGGISVIATESVPPGLVLIDTPDIDSIAQHHHTRALELLDIADQWLFITTAARYADARWWEILDQALERNSAVALVVNRVPTGSKEEVVSHLAAMLKQRWSQQIPIFSITEQTLTDGLITSHEGQEVSAWLNELASHEASRQNVVRQTIAGMATSVGEQVVLLGDDVAQYNQLAHQYRTHLDTIFDSEKFLNATAQGNLIRDEVLSQWTQSLGTSAWMHRLQRGVGQLRDRIIGKGHTTTDQVQREIHSHIATVLSDIAHEYVETAWKLTTSDPLFSDEELPHSLQEIPPEFEEAIAAELKQWHNYLVSLVLTQGQGKRRSAQVAAGGVNAVAVALMLVAFATTGGLVGAEVAIAGGSAVVGQKLLEAIFGEGAVRKLSQDALADLRVRADQLLEQLATPFTQLAPHVELGEVTTYAQRLISEAQLLEQGRA